MKKIDIILTRLLTFEIGKYLGGYGESSELNHTIELNTNTLQVKYINPKVRNKKCPTYNRSNSNEDEPVSIDDIIKISTGFRK
ncbi:hypothetical protein [Clostridium tertium]|uniref:Uncharacterized protein n=1 Tax=Clostridium tertium TaxID=1559 RepID=A0A6N3GUE0_9CLOT